MKKAVDNLYAYADILQGAKPPIMNRYQLTAKARLQRSRRAVRTLRVKAALKKLFPMEMHLMAKKEID